MTDDLPFDYGDRDRPAIGATHRATCRRHRWIVGGSVPELIGTCTRCGKARDVAASRRGKNNGKRGRSDELKVANLLGGRKVGQMAWPWDVEVEGYMRAQSKQLDAWPSINEIVKWLDAIPSGPYLRAVTLADTPGAGHRTRRLIVLDLNEFAAWHGRENE